MTAMLASVSSAEEAALVLRAGVDIIDLKQPAQGALGALEVDLVKQIVHQIQGQRPVSATIGDLPMQPDTIFNAVGRMANSGVDYVKIGFFPGGDTIGTLNKLAGLTMQGIKMIAVLFADTKPDLEIISNLARADFTGVMLDTMDKQKGALTDIMQQSELQQFVDHARQHRLLSGLAGSLQIQDIPELLPLQPDYLGFRGALCSQHQRTAQLDETAVVKIKAAFTPEAAKSGFSLPAAQQPYMDKAM